MTSEYLTVEQVAAELEMSTSGVYKLIQRGTLKAIKRSARGTRVPRIAFDAYLRRMGGGASRSTRPRSDVTFQTLSAKFRDETGMDPEAWLGSWRRGALEDSPQNMRMMMAACALETWNEDPEHRRHVASVLGR